MVRGTNMVMQKKSLISAAPAKQKAVDDGSVPRQRRHKEDAATASAAKLATAKLSTAKLNTLRKLI